MPCWVFRVTDMIYNERTVDGDYIFIRPKVRALDEENLIKKWTEELFDCAAHGSGEKIVIDFQSVYILTSSVLSVLLRFRAHLIDRHTDLALCCLSENIMSAFRITCLDRVFVIGKDRDEVKMLLNVSADE